MSSTPELELSSPQPKNPRLQWPRWRASGAGEGCLSEKLCPAITSVEGSPRAPPAWGTSREETGIKEDIPRVFLQKCFCIWSLGEFSCLLKGERRLVLKPRLLFLAGATCPAKSLGLIFPILGVLALKGLPSPPPPPPPGAQLAAGGGSFHLGPQPGFERAGGPYLPGHAQLPAREALPGQIQ